MNRNARKWILLFWCEPKGHRVFREVGSGRLAIADNSGNVPSETDDGVLWLNTDRPLMLAHGNHGMRVNIPLIVERTGDTSMTLGAFESALTLAKKLNWSVAFDQTAPDSTMLNMLANGLNGLRGSDMVQPYVSCQHGMFPGENCEPCEKINKIPDDAQYDEYE